MVAFDSNVLTAFLAANSAQSPATGDQLAAFRLFMYAPELTILPTVTAESERIPSADKKSEHLKWVWYHFPEAQLQQYARPIGVRAQELLCHHPQKDLDDCQIVAEAEFARVTALATIDKRIKKLQPYTVVKLLTPDGVLSLLNIGPGTPPRRLPADRHPLAHASWWPI